MTLKRSARRLIDLRKAPKDIVEGMKKNGNVGNRFNMLARVGKKLTQLLRSDALKK